LQQNQNKQTNKQTNSKHWNPELKKLYVSDIEIPEEIKQARNWLQSNNKIYSNCKDNMFHIVYPIVGLKGNVGYLSVYLNHQLTESENLVIPQLLNISNNFHSLLEENQRDKLTGLLNRKTFDDNVPKIQATLNSIEETDDYSGVEKRNYIINSE
jgi:GGDEF domain-containing protein